jgi:two-component system OmpR family response regulator
VHIAVIEDNQSMAKGIAFVLRDQGHAVDLLHDGTQADTFLRSDASDLVILDINLPGISGLEILKTLRASGDARPVILLTARSDTHERVAGLDAGADDYLIKPFDMAELLARVRALSRRRDREPVYSEKIGALEFNVTTRQVKAGNETLNLPRRELALLEILLKSRDRSISKASILDALYGTGESVEEKVVEVYVSRLRKRLEPYGVRIRVRRGLGYYIEEVG